MESQQKTLQRAGEEGVSPGGMGEGTLILSYIHRLGLFFWGGGVKILNFNLLGFFRKMNIFGGMLKLWIFLGAIAKLDYFGELFLYILGLFLRSRYIIGIFFGLLTWGA